MQTLQLEKNELIRPGAIDRDTVRRYVSEYTDRLEAASERGDNVHQLALDQQDQVDRMTSSWGEEDRLLFSKLYVEELNAYADGANDGAAKLNLQTAQIHAQSVQDASNVATWISLIVFFGFLFFMIKIFKG